MHGISSTGSGCAVRGILVQQQRDQEPTQVTRSRHPVKVRCAPPKFQNSGFSEQLDIVVEPDENGIGSAVSA